MQQCKHPDLCKISISTITAIYDDVSYSVSWQGSCPGPLAWPGGVDLVKVQTTKDLNPSALLPYNNIEEC